MRDSTSLEPTSPSNILTTESNNKNAFYISKHIWKFVIVSFPQPPSSGRTCSGTAQGSVAVRRARAVYQVDAIDVVNNGRFHSVSPATQASQLFLLSGSIDAAPWPHHISQTINHLGR